MGENPTEPEEKISTPRDGSLGEEDVLLLPMDKGIERNAPWASLKLRF